MKTLAIIGCGELGMQIGHYALTDKHFQKVVYFDDFSSGITSNGKKIIGKIIDIENTYKKNEFDELFIGIGYKHMEKRKEIFEKFHHKIPFANIIHSSAYVDPTVKIGSGTIIYPMCVIDKQVTIEDNVLINNNVVVSHDSSIGAHSFLSPSVAIAGFVSIGNRNIIGINTTIVDTLFTANQIQTGAGTVVIKNLLKSGLYVGNPARFIR
ncbi:NeuD/PglB/VioB family sugar acetyltransferase [Psychroflexus halocasei]|uniref:Sugar O-acyltransferase, sialic acid O-acetyltransferase NeuD family n=1 Tax=Psychroflexus halocasei TaxID=908615 RepID=A0A1H4D995_9FLAO|nr:NeuD/PglB/VioB family sugar acetyltransferase [Psychroflexus halocasei]SEA69128.1 sugar O-acyltransferase, sialic acid O-acetyltransferase NeuD family [Psychroflexus halocasei]